MNLTNKNEILSSAREVLNLEAKAIQNLENNLDDNFVAVINEILNSNGRVIVCGIGKSAIIAQKIVATMNSTGQKAVFLHAADAIHGDLGILDKNDIVICISKSGDTPEIKVLVPMLKRLANKLIALVSSVDSYLGQNADYVLAATVEKEAGKLNLAPTTSTAAAMALGDAIAITLLEQRGFSKDDFAKYHPGGSLGKKMYLKVDDIITKHQLPIVHLSSGVQEVIYEISAKRIGAVAVVDEKNNLLGIITDGDLRRMLEKWSDISGKTAEDIMTKNPKSIQLGEYAVQALYIMQEKNINQLVVLKGEQVKGFVHLHDLLDEGLV